MEIRQRALTQQWAKEGIARAIRRYRTNFGNPEPPELTGTVEGSAPRESYK